MRGHRLGDMSETDLISSQQAAYVADRFAWKRRLSRVVHIGPVKVGGEHPLVVQSMTTTPTTDVAATVAQSIRLAEAGCQMVRITAPAIADAQALAAIRREFSAAGFADVPLIADIHFMPAAAMEAVEHVEKVRINPGNFADRKRFQVIDYSDADYAAELERLHERFSPLVKRAKTLGRAMRIGVNHGSLSDRIMNRYGDTPRGMVESALEFIAIAEDHGYRDLILSMKSSNPKVMIQAYRLLVAMMDDKTEPYPLHIGVTEAGDGEDGRIKGACGIGGLLEDGLGDTIRVSLTEEPEAEIPVANALAALYAEPEITGLPHAPAEAVDFYEYRRRNAEIIRLGSANGPAIGGGQVPAVLAPERIPHDDDAGLPADAAVSDGRRPQAGIQKRPETSATLPVPLQDDPRMAKDGDLVLLDLQQADPAKYVQDILPQIPAGTLLGIGNAGAYGPTRAYRLLAAADEVTFLQAEADKSGSGIRHAICLALPETQDLLQAASIAGALLTDGIGDCIYTPALPHPVRQGFAILQAIKARVTRADYVACPSCGRTLFDLMEVTEHIKQATNHLDGVTIAIMGCIVNGPGEMADADFGYVGSHPGKITLYRGKEAVRRNLPMADARDALIDLIKEHGMWKDP